MNKDELIQYKNYLYALKWYKEFGNKYLDKIYIDNYEEKQNTKGKGEKNENNILKK